MQLISLKTKNFKKLGDFECAFGPGLNVIAGENFAGKSTLLQAIEAALFGVSVVPGKAEHIPTWGQKNFGLDLCFKGLDGNTYQVARDKSTAKLKRILAAGEPADDLVANGTTPVKTAIEELLGLPSKDYNLFIQSRQGESAGILTFGATALNRKVEEHAGVDVIERVQQAAQLRASRLNARAENRPLPEQLATARENHEAATGAWNAANAAHTAAQEELEAFGEFAGEVVANRAPEMRKDAQAAAVLLAVLEGAEAAVPTAEAAVAEAQARVEGQAKKDPEELQAKQKIAYDKGVAAKTLLEALRRDQQDYALALRTVDARKAELKQAEDAVLQPSAVGLLQEAEDKLEAAVKASNVALQTLNELELRERNTKQLAAGAKCPTCGHAKEDHDPEQLRKELEDITGQLTEVRKVASNASRAEVFARAELKSLEDQDAKAQASLDAVGEAERKLGVAQANLDNLTKVDDSQINDAEGTQQQAREEYAAIQEELKSVQAHNQRIDADMAALSRATKQLDEAKAKVKELDEQYAELPEPPTDEEIEAAEQAYQGYLAAHQQWRDRHSELSTCESAARTELHHQSNLVDIAKSAVDALVEQDKAALEAEAEAKKCERLVRFLRDGRQGYMKQVWDSILAISSRLVSDASAGTITRLENVEGDFQFEEDGVLAPTSSASGAQRAFIGTSLRIGLSRALYGSDSLLSFDEPTESCNERNASGMAAMLASSAKQVLLITHRENDQALAEHIINVGV
jgi:exonuclease SbcC